MPPLQIFRLVVHTARLCIPPALMPRATTFMAIYVPDNGLRPPVQLWQAAKNCIAKVLHMHVSRTDIRQSGPSAYT